MSGLIISKSYIFSIINSNKFRYTYIIILVLSVKFFFRVYARNAVYFLNICCSISELIQDSQISSMSNFCWYTHYNAKSFAILPCPILTCRTFGLVFLALFENFWFMLCSMKLKQVVGCYYFSLMK